MTALTINSFVSSQRFDPIEYIKSLRNLGVKQEVAEVQAKELEHVIEQTRQETRQIFENKELATKGDIENTKLTLQKEIETVRKEIEVVRKEIADVRYDTLKFIIWTGVGVTAAMIATLGGMLAHGFHWW